MTVSALGPRTCEILCVPFWSGVSISPSPLELSKVSPTDLQSQAFWGIIFPVQDPQDEEPEVGLRPLTPCREPLQCNYSPICGLPIWVHGI